MATKQVTKAKNGSNGKVEREPVDFGFRVMPLDKWVHVLRPYAEKGDRFCRPDYDDPTRVHIVERATMSTICTLSIPEHLGLCEIPDMFEREGWYIGDRVTMEILQRRVKAMSKERFSIAYLLSMHSLYEAINEEAVTPEEAIRSGYITSEDSLVRDVHES